MNSDTISGQANSENEVRLLRISPRMIIAAFSIIDNLFGGCK